MASSKFDVDDRSTRRIRPNRAAGLLTGLLLGALLLLPGTAGAIPYPYPPTAGLAVRTTGGFELTGTVYPYGTDTTYHFEYGTTTTYGTSVPMPDADAGTATSVPVSQTITGLAPNTTYHYRLVSTNSSEGTPLSSADRTFSTAETTTTAPVSGGSSPEPGSGAGTMEYPGAGGGSVTVSGKGPKTVAKTVKSKGRSLLATTSGRTLYSLSAEQRGKFVCTAMSGCTSIWNPLTVAAGVIPKGPVKLGTIHRPEGALQVTYRGLPLYTFASDKKPGQVKGEGLKDVGVWHAAFLPTKSPH